ncbi:MAG: hypothetical protein JWN20_2287 [Jatrophihabitantaceae bacterium]|nr:hypothetical protein [Jatrophihabitantaceae bacterium]
MGTAREDALAALNRAVESGGTTAQIAHAASQLATAQVEEALASRAVIEQAKGIIMCERRCTPDEAFQVLRQVSQKSNARLHDLAQALVDSACERPPSP